MPRLSIRSISRPALAKPTRSLRCSIDVEPNWLVTIELDGLQEQVEVAADVLVDLLLLRRRGGEDLFAVLGLGLPLGELDDRLDLGVGDVGALHADRLAGADRHEERVTHADQLLRARLVEDDPAVGEAGGGERQPRGHVGLDQAGDDVDRRAAAWPAPGGCRRRGPSG